MGSPESHDALAELVKALAVQQVKEMGLTAEGGLLGSHFLVRKLDGGNRTHTLATRLGDALAAAEKRFGPRDTSWTILGWEVGPTNPRIVYPQPLEAKQVVIQLSDAARFDEAQAVFQIAHECVHLLSPSPEPANVLEEGLASAFSEAWVSLTMGRCLTVGSTDAYGIACQKARRLLAFDADAVLKLRAVEPVFSRMTRDTFTEAGVTAPDELIDALLAPFVRIVD